MVGDVAADDLVAAVFADRLEILAGKFPRRLDGLGPRRREEDAVEVARGQGGESAGQLDRRGVGVGPHGEVGELLRLLRHGLGDGLAAIFEIARERALAAHGP